MLKTFHMELSLRQVRERSLLRDMSRKRSRKSSVDLDPVEFLVGFINTDLEGLSQEDVLKLWRGIGAFENSGTPNLELWADDRNDMNAAERHDPRRLKELQLTLCSLLQPIAERQSGTARPAAPLHPDESGSKDPFWGDWSSVSFGHCDVSLGIAQGPDEATRIVLQGPFFHILYAKAALLLLVMNHPTRSRLRCCPECSAVFLRIRKQRYCTRRCVNRANMRTWLKDRRGKASHRASSKRSYEKRIRTRLNPNLKIAGRKAKEGKAK